MKRTAMFLALLAGCGVSDPDGPRVDAGMPSTDAQPEAEPPAPDDGPDRRALLELIDQYTARGLFMGTALIARRGVVLLDAARGYANAEWEVPNTRNTRFRIGSISKTFTAVAILLLEEEGKLDTSAPLRRYLPDVPLAWNEITLHQLLTHTSGIPDVWAREDYPVRRTQPSTPERNYRQLRDLPLDFAPGAQFKYSNSGFLVLAYLIEQVTGQSFDAFVAARITGPHGLADTGPDGQRPLLKRRADGYVPLLPVMGVPPPTPYRNADFIDMSFPTGAGSFLSTTGDLHRYMQALQSGRVVQPASWAKITTPSGGPYGYGFYHGTHNGSRRMGMGGYIHGFMSSFTYFPDHDVIFVVLANLTASEGLSELNEKLIARTLGLPPPDAGPTATPVTDAGARDAPVD